MTKGRPPAPKAIAAMKGDKRRTKAKEPDAPSGVPDCPKHLDAIAKGEWLSIVKHLKAMGILSIADRQVIEQYCVSYSRWRKAAEIIMKEGDVAFSPNSGSPKYSPYAIAYDKSQEQCRKLLIELGLTPAARGRMRLANEEEPDSKWGDFLKIG